MSKALAEAEGMIPSSSSSSSPSSAQAGGEAASTSQEEEEEEIWAETQGMLEEVLAKAPGGVGR